MKPYKKHFNYNFSARTPKSNMLRLVSAPCPNVPSFILLSAQKRGIIVPNQLVARSHSFAKPGGDSRSEQILLGSAVLQDLKVLDRRGHTFRRTKMIDNFEEMGLEKSVRVALSDELQVFHPSPCQQLAIDSGTSRKGTVVVISPEGSGKTLACLAPAYSNMVRDRDIYKIPTREFRPRMVVLAPTRDILHQLQHVCSKLDKTTGLKSLVMTRTYNFQRKFKHKMVGTLGGRKRLKTINLLKKATAETRNNGIDGTLDVDKILGKHPHSDGRPIDVLVMHPHMILTLIRCRRLFIDDLRYVYVDEADVMLSSDQDYSTNQLISKIFKRNMYRHLPPVNTQYYFSSFGTTRKMSMFLQRWFPDAVHCVPSEAHKAPENVKFMFYPVNTENEKITVLEHLLNSKTYNYPINKRMDGAQEGQRDLLWDDYGVLKPSSDLPPPLKSAFVGFVRNSTYVNNNETDDEIKTPGNDINLSTSDCKAMYTQLVDPKRPDEYCRDDEKGDFGNSSFVPKSIPQKQDDLTYYQWLNRSRERMDVLTCEPKENSLSDAIRVSEKEQKNGSNKPILQWKSAKEVLNPEQYERLMDETEKHILSRTGGSTGLSKVELNESTPLARVERHINIRFLAAQMKNDAEAVDRKSSFPPGLNTTSPSLFVPRGGVDNLQSPSGAGRGNLSLPDKTPQMPSYNINPQILDSDKNLVPFPGFENPKYRIHLDASSKASHNCDKAAGFHSTISSALAIPTTRKYASAALVRPSVRWHNVITHAAPFTYPIPQTFVPISGLRTIIFCTAINACAAIYFNLRDKGYNVTLIHGTLPGPVRESMMRRFASGQSNILVATDVAARGLDLPVDVVINFQMPTTAVSFLARAGRTGRMNRKGSCYSLYHKKRQKTIATALRILSQKGLALSDVSNDKDHMSEIRYGEWKYLKKNALSKAYVSLITKSSIPIGREKTYVRHNALWRPIWRPNTVAKHGGVPVKQQEKLMSKVRDQAHEYRKKQLSMRKGGKAKFGASRMTSTSPYSWKQGAFSTRNVSGMPSSFGYASPPTSK